MDLTHPYKVNDYIKVEKVFKPKFKRVVTFPTVIYGDYDKIVGISTEDGEVIKHPMLGFIIELIRWGHENLEGYRKVKLGAEKTFPSINVLPYDYEPRPDRELKKILFPKGAEKQSIALNAGPRGPRGNVMYNGVTGLEYALFSAISTGRTLHDYDNPVPQFCVDDTPEQVAWLRGRMSAPDFPKIDSDSRWERTGGNARRGISDYTRVVTFASPPTAEHLDIFTKFLALDKCPGYTGIVTRSAGVRFTFTTTHDSSD